MQSKKDRPATVNLISCPSCGNDEDFLKLLKM